MESSETFPCHSMVCEHALHKVSLKLVVPFLRKMGTYKQNLCNFNKDLAPLLGLSKDATMSQRHQSYL